MLLHWPVRLLGNQMQEMNWPKSKTFWMEKKKLKPRMLSARLSPVAKSRTVLKRSPPWPLKRKAERRKATGDAPCAVGIARGCRPRGHAGAWSPEATLVLKATDAGTQRQHGAVPNCCGLYGDADLSYTSTDTSIGYNTYRIRRYALSKKTH